MDGIGTNEHTLIEILCTKENDEVQTLVDTYESCKFSGPDNKQHETNWLVCFRNLTHPQNQILKEE